MKPMETEIRALVQAIHDRPGRIVVVTAGAGTQALAWLLGVAGASRTLLEALIPYDEAAFDDFLGQTPPQYVASETAGLLAGRALTRARHLNAGPEPLIGLACTATIVTDRPKRGPHRAHVATWRDRCICRYTLHLDKGQRDRNGEEEMVSRLMLNALAKAYDLDGRAGLDWLPGDSYEVSRSDLEQAAIRLQRGADPYYCIEANGTLHNQLASPVAMLAGAFNPLHEGHLALATAAAAIVGQPVVFELTAVNADKEGLTLEQIVDRLSQFAGRYTVLASSAPTFLAKSRLFPNATFIVGYDTAERILQPRFYHNNQTEMLAALAEIRKRGGRFLVAGRLDEVTNEFQEPNQLAVPEPFGDLFQSIPPGRFRRDISSTWLRQTGRKGSR
jgi:hypothetical protein